MIALLLLLPLFGVLAQEAPAAWELRVCAESDNLPYSNREREGFENRIIEVVADELQARLEYRWMPQPSREGQEELMLRYGECDLLLGVPDGADPFLTTIAYYRSTSVFVTRADAPFEVVSLDDEELRTLRVGVQRGSPEDSALVRRGITDNVRHFFVSDPGGAILDGVADGTLDVGIVWGPIAGYHAQRLDAPLELAPVSPEVDMPFLPMFQAISMGVRMTDDGFRDLLDRAIAARWDEIRVILDEYGVPLLPLPRPEVTLP